METITKRLFSTKTQIIRSSLPEMFCKKGVLRNVTKFTGKQLCLRPATY